MTKTLQAMEFDILMDNAIDPDKHFISPGGYELNNKQFDFIQYRGYIDEKDSKRLHVHVFEPDIDSFKRSITPKDTTEDFQEFFIYTGDTENEPINPVRIESLVLYWNDRTSTAASGPLTESANKAIINA